MIGLFDSGAGGVNTLAEIKRLLPRESLLLLADYERAPYGEKTPEELVSVIEDNIRRLTAAGASPVLIACCTASAMYEGLSEGARKIAIPIILPTARAVLSTGECRRIAVIATEATVRSHAFSAALPNCEVEEIPAGDLVRICEAGGEDNPELPRVIDHLIGRAARFGADALILGCTHFHSVRRTIEVAARERGITKIISSAREGAEELYRILKNEGGAR